VATISVYADLRPN